MSNIVIFGTGVISEFLSKHVKSTTHIVGYLNNIDKIGKFNEIKVYQRVEDLPEYDYILVGFPNVKKGIEFLLAGGVSAKKIVGYSFNLASPYCCSLAGLTRN